MEQQLSRYLRLATWGLPKQKKLEIQAELRGNIEILSLEYQVQGMSKPEALQAALRDFGQPERVCAGMTKVYIMPVILRNVGLAVLLSSFGMGALNSSNAQIRATNSVLTTFCLTYPNNNISSENKKVQCKSSLISLHMPSLEKTLKGLGVKVKSYTSQWKTTELYFPKAKRSIFIRRYETQLPEGQSISTNSDYIMANDFINELRDTGLPITLRDWNYPTIGVGKTEFRIGEFPNQVQGSSIVRMLLENDLRTLFSSKASTSLETSDNAVVLGKSEQRIRFKVKNGKVGELYAVVTIEPIKDVRMLQFLKESQECKCQKRIYLQPMTISSQLETFTQAKTLKAVANIEALQPIKKNGAGNFVVMKFSGRLDLWGKVFEIIPASQVTMLK
jgi:hypothetical protein